MSIRTRGHLNMPSFAILVAVKEHTIIVRIYGRCFLIEKCWHVSTIDYFQSPMNPYNKNVEF